MLAYRVNLVKSKSTHQVTSSSPEPVSFFYRPIKTAKDYVASNFPRSKNQAKICHPNNGKRGGGTLTCDRVATAIKKNTKILCLRSVQQLLAANFSQQRKFKGDFSAFYFGPELIFRKEGGGGGAIVNFYSWTTPRKKWIMLDCCDYRDTFRYLPIIFAGSFFFLDVAVAIKLLLLLIFVAGDFLDDCCRVLWASVAIKIFRLMTTETGFCVRQLKFSSGWNFPVLATSKEKDVIKPRRAIINTITITIKGTVLKRQGFSSWREGFKLGFAVNGFVLIEKVWSFWMTEIEFNCEIDLT